MRCGITESRQFALQVYALHARLLATFPGETNSLLPRHVNHWWPLVEDIFMSPRITSLEQELKAELVHHEEFEVVSMDATLRCCLPIMGQAHPRASREEKMRAAFHGETALTRAFWLHLCQLFVLLGLFLLYQSAEASTEVVTCRGRTNAVLMLCATTTDEADVLVEAMANNLPASGLRQVRCVAVDNPSTRLWQSLRHICPNLQVLALDPVHLAMTCEYASGRKRTALTKTLRLILRKLTVHSPHCTEKTWGRVFRGDNCKALTREEEKARSQIEDRSMPLKKATALLENLDGSVPFFERCEWTQSLAAVAAVYRDDMDRVVPGPNRKVVQLLHTAAAAARTEWYLNNLRARHMISSKRLSLLPVGTTSNESLHHEINNFFRETQKIHKTTLSLKLKILQLSKLMTHNAALYYETTRQMAEAEVLARTCSKEMWSSEQWREWCEQLQGNARIEKAPLQLHPQREEERAKVKESVRKKPAGNVHSSSLKRRRTPHTLDRQDNLRRAGVRGRKPAA